MHDYRRKKKTVSQKNTYFSHYLSTIPYNIVQFRFLYASVSIKKQVCFNWSEIYVFKSWIFFQETKSGQIYYTPDEGDDLDDSDPDDDLNI